MRNAAFANFVSIVGVALQWQQARAKARFYLQILNAGRD
jgi:hypothetical protein